MFLPGIVETRADVELVLRAISSDRFIIFETLTPGAGSNSYKLTTGPLFIFVILPSIPKSNNIFSIKDPSGLFFERSNKLILDGFFSKKSKEGSLKFFNPSRKKSKLILDAKTKKVRARIKKIKILYS